MLSWLRSLFSTTPDTLLHESDPMKKYLIIGLGNIGAEYDNTRHNIGFKVVDALIENEETSFEPAKLGAVANFKFKGRSVLCIKPSTYMNLSGKAVAYWMAKEKVPLENVLIVTDDINLPFGTLRLKTKGSDGGHNGLKNIQNVLQTAQYPRLRFGVGSEFSKGKQVDYVLGQWNESEEAALNERLERTTALIRSFIFAGVKNTMNAFNGT
ncbi:aminoacyl-tRNA hydrolase [Flagellimonas sp. DF-77]|uniref:aminoacyl-tRNA hydrolase n=1 Tax=Flagellimonas algarum TaxID=3230298 RepID=UPI0033927A6F